jgi:hypothetical protein
MPWTGARGPGPPVQGGPIKGVRLLLIWVVRADRTAQVARRRGRWGIGRPTAAPGGARRRGSPEEPRTASRPPIRAEKAPGGRGEDGDAYQGLGGEGITAEEEIWRRLRRRRSGSGVDRAVHAEGASEEAVRVEEVSRAPYMGRRGEGEKVTKAVGGALQRRPLMAAVRGGGA